jgi:hypothetical protein
MTTGHRTTASAHREVLLLDLPQPQAELYVRLRAVPSTRFAEGVAARSAAERLPYPVLVHCHLMTVIDEVERGESELLRTPVLPYSPADALTRLTLELPRGFRPEPDPLADSVRFALLVTACRSRRQVAKVRYAVTQAYWESIAAVPRQRAAGGVAARGASADGGLAREEAERRIGRLG